ncbi:MAG TPA: Holliday junction resolvase-like protein [Candidatus Acidoferrales bacterium]|nr:Holliday junction resolvase-like protein [Candidatus Acidoferrales bacterium]
MIDEIVRFFAIQRNIFGLCPCCGELFRLSDCRVYLRTKPQKDWMDILESKDNRLNRKEEKIDEIEEALREKARAAGRRMARRAITRIDPIFAPRRLNADDAKVLFHPVDYVVFCGMKDSGAVREIVLLDRKAEAPKRRRVQRSIEKVVEAGKYDWLTVRVQNDGTIVEE